MVQSPDICKTNGEVQRVLPRRRTGLKVGRGEEPEGSRPEGQAQQNEQDTFCGTRVQSHQIREGQNARANRVLQGRWLGDWEKLQ